MLLITEDDISFCLLNIVMLQLFEKSFINKFTNI